MSERAETEDIKLSSISRHCSARWWLKLSDWDELFEKKWIPRIELIAGITTMIVLTLNLLWGGKSR
jgi:hypothetical protein